MLGPYTNEDSEIEVLTVAEAFRRKYNDSIEILYSEGVEIDSENTEYMEQAIDYSKQSDAIVLVLGDDGSTCGEWFVCVYVYVCVSESGIFVFALKFLSSFLLFFCFFLFVAKITYCAM